MKRVSSYHNSVCSQQFGMLLSLLACTALTACVACPQFFISPLCLASSLEREVLAVDSEFSGVVQDDGCRANQLMCHTVRAWAGWVQI
jgi:hypothetical protein